MSPVLSRRKHLPYFALVTPPVVGVASGFVLAILYPPAHPDDRMFAWIISVGGLGVIGLLLGFLGWLWTRGRISFSSVIAAIAIPSCLFGWFISGKAGRWDVAWWFGLCGMMVMAVFFARAISRIGDRDGGVRID